MDKQTLIIAAGAILLVMNCLSFSLMAYDKRCAAKGKWRVPEKTLFLVTGLFGGLGGVLGMQILRHKTKHWYFKVFFPVMLILQIVLLVIAFRALG
ncbi:MAG: DUF1294 domain-containing protein [Clostridiales bacterium]|nr:DUF1294 domain-containing protein [Clostridia bacterium]MCR4883080.1 DUF1294 domain-containing protein [Clostridiales bacterium]